MVLAYYRLGKHEDARRSLRQLMRFADGFRMDNPLTKCGSDVYQPNLPINLTYDAFGPPAAFVRGLFEYRYSADGLTLAPSLPLGLAEVNQLFPIRFGKKYVYVSACGAGEITSVRVNGKRWRRHDERTVFLPYGTTPDQAHVQIGLGDSEPEAAALVGPALPSLVTLPVEHDCDVCREIGCERGRFEAFYRLMGQAGLGERYEAAHARLALACALAAHERVDLVKQGAVPLLPSASQAAAQRAFTTSARQLHDGLVRVLATYAETGGNVEKHIAALWRESEGSGR